ncbi:hypothetical protein Tco_1430943 [Tanacetum coccineum]
MTWVEGTPAPLGLLWIGGERHEDVNDPLLLTPLCCDDIHDVTPRVSALAGCDTPPHHVPTSCMGCFANRGKGKQKPNLGGRAAGRPNTSDKTRNLSLKEITDKKGHVPIRYELRDKQTLMPLSDHAAHWSSYIGEVIRTQFDLRPHMESPDWTEINAGIQQHLQKAYNTNKAAFKAEH